MKIVKPYARIHSDPREQFGGMRHIEWCARISHRSEESQSSDSWKRFIETVVLGHGDWSVVEHVSVTVDAVVDRGITHEWVRHRLFSFTQESTRFVNYEKKMPPAFIYPKPEIECAHCLSGEEIQDCDLAGYCHGHEPCAYDKGWLRAIADQKVNGKRGKKTGKGPRDSAERVGKVVSTPADQQPEEAF